MNIYFKNLGHTYVSPQGEARTVLHIPEWQIANGEQILLRGVSGSGKTTLFNIMAGLLAPTEGQIAYDSQDLYALSPKKRDRFRAQMIGYIFQNHYLISSMSALENVVMPMAFAGKYPRSQWRDRAMVLLDRMGLGDYMDYRPAQLSTGQRLRVAVARGLANMPPVLLCDEPTAALDPESAENVMNFIQETCVEEKTILVVASHDPALNERFDEVVYLKAGEISEEVRLPL